MVLAEQIKEIEQRREALERCLDIDQKRIDLRNEEEKTQEPNFWDNPDKAREQLRKVAGIKAWVEDQRRGGRHGGARLGVDAHAHVHPLGRGPRL